MWTGVMEGTDMREYKKGGRKGFVDKRKGGKVKGEQCNGLKDERKRRKAGV